MKGLLMKAKTIMGLLVLVFSALVFADADTSEQPSPEERAYFEQAEKIWNELDRKTGDIDLGEGGAKLHVPEDYYFLNAKDAATVLVDVWGNPPGQDVLGMLFPSHMTPFDHDSWAVTVEYEEEGYVSDKDAQDIDYQDLLADMKEDTQADNKDRVKQGYEAITLVGWAEDPYYDAVTHKLHWAKELKFGNQEINTLNYNIRVLGRKGVLILNFIAGMDQKAVIDTELNSVLAMADFEQGSSYADFNPDLDKVAAYGLGALVAGKVIAKTGFIAVLLIFLKKFGVFIVIGIGALCKKLFSRKQD